MDGFVFILCCIVIGCLAGLIDQWMKLKAKKSSTEPRIVDLGARLEKIERRVANLETILLERAKEDEFEKLRVGGESA